MLNRILGILFKPFRPNAEVLQSVLPPDLKQAAQRAPLNMHADASHQAGIHIFIIHLAKIHRAKNG